jgi:hypothetical protein
MRDSMDAPLAFVRDLLDSADDDEPSPARSSRAADPAMVASRAAMLDATANVLGALRELLQAGEDMVRLRRDRLTTEAEEPPPPTPLRRERPRERVDFTY